LETLRKKTVIISSKHTNDALPASLKPLRVEDHPMFLASFLR
jgi:hypothetical protein